MGGLLSEQFCGDEAQPMALAGITTFDTGESVSERGYVAFSDVSE